MRPTDAMHRLQRVLQFIIESWRSPVGALLMLRCSYSGFSSLDRMKEGQLLRGLRIGRLSEKGIEWFLWTLDWLQRRNEDAVQEADRRTAACGLTAKNF